MTMWVCTSGQRSPIFSIFTLLWCVFLWWQSLEPCTKQTSISHRVPFSGTAMRACDAMPANCTHIHRRISLCLVAVRAACCACTLPRTQPWQQLVHIEYGRSEWCVCSPCVYGCLHPHACRFAWCLCSCVCKCAWCVCTFVSMCACVPLIVCVCVCVFSLVCGITHVCLLTKVCF